MIYTAERSRVKKEGIYLIGESKCAATNSSSPQEDNNGKLVHVTGSVSTDEQVMDEELGL